MEDRSISVSDRVLLLANQVAAALTEQYPDKFVAFYAYNYHSPPPNTVRAHPKVIVNVATAFIKEATRSISSSNAGAKWAYKSFGIRNTTASIRGSRLARKISRLQPGLPDEHHPAFSRHGCPADERRSPAITGRLTDWLLRRLPAVVGVADAKTPDAIIDDFSHSILWAGARADGRVLRPD